MTERESLVETVSPSYFVLFKTVQPNPNGGWLDVNPFGVTCGSSPSGQIV